MRARRVLAAETEDERLERMRQIQENVHYDNSIWLRETTWTRAWSVEYPLMKREGPLYEYACHEGNHDARQILEVARNLDKAAVRSSSGTGSRR